MSPTDAPLAVVLLSGGLDSTTVAAMARTRGYPLLALNIDVARPPKKMRTMAQIFTSKGKGKNREENPIGFSAPLKAPSLTLPSAGSPQGSESEFLRTP